MVAQIRDRARKADHGEADLPEVVEQRARAHVRAAVDLDDQRPYDLQKTLRLEGTWNVTPQDLVESKRRGTGSMVVAVRRLARPAIKLFANLELPLYKQFKINLGIADALNELLCRTSDLEARLGEATRRLEALEADRHGNGADD